MELWSLAVTHLLEADLIKSLRTRSELWNHLPALSFWWRPRSTAVALWSLLNSRWSILCRKRPLHTCRHHPLLFSYKAAAEQSLIRGCGLEIDGSVGKVLAGQNEPPNLRPRLPCKKSNMAVCDVILVLGRQRPEGSWS